MSAVELRPRFRLRVPFSLQVVKERINEGLVDTENPLLLGTISDHHALLQFPSADRTMWSPQMDLSFEEGSSENETIIRGFVGPSSGLWTFYMFLYFAMGIGFMVTLTWGYSEFSMNNIVWILACSPIFLIGIAILYFVAKYGQRSGKPQTRILKHFMIKILDEKYELIPREDW